MHARQLLYYSVMPLSLEFNTYGGYCFEHLIIWLFLLVLYSCLERQIKAFKNLAKISKTNDSSFWLGYKERETLVHYWWVYIHYGSQCGSSSGSWEFCLNIQSFKSIWLITSVSFTVSLFSFYFHDLSIAESGVLKFPTIIVWGAMCALSFSKVSFMNVGALAFGT